MNVNKNAVYVRDAISIPGVHAQFSFSLAAINRTDANHFRIQPIASIFK
jgi:hypothetical protein